VLIVWQVLLFFVSQAGWNCVILPMLKQSILLVIVVISISAKAQFLLKGKVMDSKADFGLGGATILNMSQHIYKQAGADGRFSILASESDVLVFSSTGYLADTILATADFLQHGLDIGLKTVAEALDTVTISSGTYAEDSLRRYMEYKNFFDQKQQNITGGNRPDNGFGVSVSPFSFFSGKERDKRKFRKRLAYNEEMAYVDYYFSSSYVHRITGLSGSPLQRFMLTYRPSYQLVRKSNSEDLLRYVNDSYKKYKLSI